MKKIIACITTLIIILSSVTIAFADTENTNEFVGWNHLEELKQNEDLAVEYANESMSLFLDKEIENNIDYEKDAFMYYRDSAISDYIWKNMSEEEFKESIDYDRYYYVVRFQKAENESLTMRYEIQKPLTDDEKKAHSQEYIESIKDKIGDFVYSRSSIDYGYLNYRDALNTAIEESGIKNSRVYVVQYPCGHIRYAAVCYNDNQTEPVIITFTEENIDDKETHCAGYQICSRKEFIQLVDEQMKHDFNIDNYSKQVKEHHGVNDHQTLIAAAIATAILVIIVAIAIIVIKKKKAKKSN